MNLEPTQIRATQSRSDLHSIFFFSFVQLSLFVAAIATVRDIRQVPKTQHSRRYTYVYNESEAVQLECVGDGSPQPK